MSEPDALPLTNQEIDLDAAFESAIHHHQAGRLSQAEMLYQVVLQWLPDHPDANHNLGVIAVQLGNPEQALPLFHAALMAQLGNGRFWISYIDALLRVQRLDEAGQWLAQGRQAGLAGPEVEQLAQRLDAGMQQRLAGKKGRVRKPTKMGKNGSIPEIAEQQQLVALFNAGQLAQCEQLARQMVASYPKHALGWKTLGAVLTQQGRNQEGLQAMRQASMLEPGDCELLSNMGVVLTQLAQYEEAEHCYRRALKIKPELASTHAYLGDALFLQHRYPQAESYCRKAIELDPEFAVAYHNLGSVLRASSRVMEAERTLRKALSLSWNYPAAHANLANALKDQSHLVEADKHLRLALAMQPNNWHIRSNLLFANIYSHAISAVQLAEEHKAYGKMIAAQAGPHAQLQRSLPISPLRIGFVSADLFRHSVSYFVEPVWDGLRAQGMKVLAYYNGKQYDDISARLHRKCDIWREVADLSDDQLVAQIQADEVDVLIDLSGHTGGNRLPVFARQPAPLQITWLGHPATTGIPAIQWRITDHHAEPEGLTEHLSSEQLYRMPEVFCCYQPSAAPAPATKPPYDETGVFTLGCFNNFAKVTPPVIDCWGELLRQLPQARLLLEIHGAEEDAFADDIRQRFVAAGARPEQVDILPRRAGQQYVLYRQVDLALDPFPCCGGTTSCDSLWMGVPFVTLAGNSFVSRMGVTLLHNIGLAELIAQDVAGYQALVLALARDLPRLRALREGLRERVQTSPLMDGPRFARHFAQGLQQMWQAQIGRAQ
jgi:predicted O-linked N-acetylglucosamine transferase (SPINDLY family)